jgi:chromosome partitioning protein
MRAIAVVNLKGGSGKTTTALCLAVGLARRLPKGKRLLLVDGDPQGNSTLTMLDGQPPAEPTLGDVLLGDVEVTEAIRPSRVAGVDLLPADAGLADATLCLTNELGREQRLKTALRSVQERYAAVIVDSPPALNLITVNILNAVSEIIVPVDAGLYSAMGLGRLQETVEKVRKHLDHDALHIIGLVVTRFMRNRASKELERQLRETYKQLVYRTVIPYSAAVEESHAHHRTVLEHAPRSTAAIAIDSLVSEVWKHGKPNSRRSKRRNAPEAA